MGEYGKRAEPAAAGRRAAPAGNALGNAPLAIRTLSPAQSVTPAQYSPGWRHQPPRTLSHQLAAMHPKTPNTSQTFPILPTKAAINRIARVCGKRRHPPTPKAAEDKPAANYPVARLPRRSVTKPGVCGEQKNGKIIAVLSAKILKKSRARCIVCNECDFIIIYNISNRRIYTDV